MNYQEIKEVQFPEYTGVNCNMMPVEKGNFNTFPEAYKQYYEMVEQTGFRKGEIVFLTVRESEITEEKPMQGRGGIHVESPYFEKAIDDLKGPVAWGGGGWGGCRHIVEGLYMASTDGACNIYDEQQPTRNTHGGCEATVEPIKCKPNTMYWLTELTPHESLASDIGTARQFVRIVGEKVGVWFSRHNTHNPLIPIAQYPKITDVDKFSLVA